MPKFNHKAHIALWDWLSKNPDKAKSEWPEWKWNGGEYTSEDECFACDYVNELDAERAKAWCEEVIEPWQYADCKDCPLVWNIEKGCSGLKMDDSFEVEFGLYTQFNRTFNDYILRSEIAKKIRDLPLKEGVEVE